MASPRTTFTGAIGLGLVSIPITIGKATGDTREGGIAQVCDHGEGEVYAIDRSERCRGCNGSPKYKTHAVKLDGGKFRVFAKTEWNQIEDATKSSVLEIQDCQPLAKLPLMYAQGTYYVRFNHQAKGGSVDAFAHFVAALHKLRAGAIVKWGSSSNEKLSILSVESGILLLRIIPFVSDIRPASSEERFHWHIDLDERKLDKMAEFLSEVRDPGGFQYAAYSNQALALRQSAVDAVLSGEQPEQLPQLEDREQEVDWMASLEQTLQQEMTKA